MFNETRENEKDAFISDRDSPSWGAITPADNRYFSSSRQGSSDDRTLLAYFASSSADNSRTSSAPSKSDVDALTRKPAGCVPQPNRPDRDGRSEVSGPPERNSTSPSRTDVDALVPRKTDCFPQPKGADDKSASPNRTNVDELVPRKTDCFPQPKGSDDNSQRRAELPQARTTAELAKLAGEVLDRILRDPDPKNSTRAEQLKNSMPDKSDRTPSKIDLDELMRQRTTPGGCFPQPERPDASRRAVLEAGAPIDQTKNQLNNYDAIKNTLDQKLRR